MGRENLYNRYIIRLDKASSGDVVIDNININSKHRTRILEKINLRPLILNYQKDYLLGKT